jgi:hypothetical protein
MEAGALLAAQTPVAFVLDWVVVAAEELLRGRLKVRAAAILSPSNSDDPAAIDQMETF